MTADPHHSQPPLRLGVALTEADRAMILLHGRGGSAGDILSLGKALGGPDFAYLAPQAANHTWYPYSFLAPLEQNEPYLSSALGSVESTLQLVMAAGISADRVIVTGFSQGACLATEFVARHPRRYAGLIAFTGGLIGPPNSDLAHPGDLAGTPVFFGSGDPDPHVPWQRVEHSAEVLRQMNADVAVHRYPGMPHTVTPSEIESARQYLGAFFIQKER